MMTLRSSLYSAKPKVLLRCGYARLASRAPPKRTKRGTTDCTSRENVLHRDIVSLLGDAKLTQEQVRIPEHLVHKFLYAKDRENVKVDGIQVNSLTSEGEGLGLVPRITYDRTCTDEKTVIKIPKAVPGDVATVYLKRHHDYYAEAELISVKREDKKGLRNDRLVVCEHFTSCSGCQFQMLSYEDQLDFKSEVIRRAYRYFYSDLATDDILGFADVVDSPMQYAYRTKLTPHAFVPRKYDLSLLPVPIGFNHAVPGKATVDINSCPIATGPINSKLPQLKDQLNGALEQRLKTGSTSKVASDFVLRDSLRVDHATGEYTNVCLTHRHNVVTEKVKDFAFQFEANEFFQNNRSILPTFIDFLGFHLSQITFKNIVDAYCGSGLLGISLSSHLPENGKVFGIEISPKAIEYAKHNAGINGIPMPAKMEFVSGNSDSMFTNEQFIKSGVKGEDSVVLMNPSRKGSTDAFLKQLVEFEPKAIVYVSCNVFTQARDLASFKTFAERSGVEYTIKAVTGFDFYPQTKHVEAVAVIEKKCGELV